MNFQYLALNLEFDVFYNPIGIPIKLQLVVFKELMVNASELLQQRWSLVFEDLNTAKISINLLIKLAPIQ